MNDLYSAGADYIMMPHLLSGQWMASILKSNKTRRHSDLTGMVSTDIDVSVIEVYLMTHDHRKKFLLKICKNYNEATAFTEEMAQTLNKKITAYSPKLSEKTQERLRYRK